MSQNTGNSTICNKISKHQKLFSSHRRRRIVEVSQNTGRSTVCNKISKLYIVAVEFLPSTSECLSMPWDQHGMVKHWWKIFHQDFQNQIPIHMATFLRSNSAVVCKICALPRHELACLSLTWINAYLVIRCDHWNKNGMGGYEKICYRNWYQNWCHQRPGKLTTARGRSPRPSGCVELPRSLVTPQWPKSRYQFLFYHDASRHIKSMQIRVSISRKYWFFRCIQIGVW